MIAAFAAVYVIWGSTYLFIKYAIETMPPWLMAGTRFALAGALLYGWVRIRGTPAPTRGAWRTAMITGPLLLLGGNGAVVWAEQRVASGITSLLVAMVPLWMVLVDWLRPGGVRPRLLTGVGIAIGLGGLLILVGPAALAGHGGGIDLGGAGVLVVGSLSWAIGSIVARQSERPSSPLLATAIQMLCGGAALVIAGLVSGEAAQVNLAAISLRSLLSYAYLVVFGSLVGYTAYVYLLGATTAARVSTYAYVNPVVAVLLGWLFAHEPITARTLVAAAVILVGVATITLAGSASRTATQPSRDAAPPSPPEGARSTSAGLRERA
ncbi:MAG: protein of unknown function transrane [Gemmatimonadetes bacterium]|nr:protein of unknown function transrane [Gemmatimonadota bacterium]